MSEAIYYSGPELKWGVDDVYLIAENDNIEIKSIEDAIEILTRTFKDNQVLMEIINEKLSYEIHEFYENE